MAIKKYVLSADQQLTEEQIKMIEEAGKRLPVIDDDAPELTDAQLAQMRRAHESRQADRKGQNVTLSLTPQAIQKAEAMGKGYNERTTVRPVLTYGDPDADVLLVQMVDDHDMEVIEQEVSCIRELTGGQNFCLRAVKVDNWNDDLSPWPAPAVFGKEDFGGGAEETLAYLLEKVPADHTRRTFIGGYSLAGLFALWAAYRTDRFDGVAAASPSVWFPGFTDYMRREEIHAGAVYLSLGDREEKTRNPVMAQVGNAIREAREILTKAGTACILVWNQGNHFKEPDIRTAKAFAWLLNRS